MDANNNELPELFPHPGKKAKSVAWDFFKFRKNEQGKIDTTTVICKVCRKEYANKGNTTNLVFHIKHEHKEHIPRPDEPVRDKNNMIQPKIRTMSGQQYMSLDRKGKLDDLLLKLIISKSLPLSLISNEVFKEFLSDLDPRYKIPSKTAATAMLNKKYLQMKDKLKMDLSSCEAVALTHDGWTSNSTQSFDTITCHMITNDWEMRHAVLGTVKIEGQHTGENIARSIQTTLDEWNLGPPSAMTTDNAANEQKAIRQLGFTRVGCFGHRINLVVKKAVKVPEMTDLLTKGRALVSFFHKSSSATDMLVEKQRLLSPDGKDHRLIMDCATRWNSTLSMIERLITETPYIVSMVNDPNLSKHASQVIKENSYSFDNVSTLSRVVNVLKPFEKATVVLCSQSAPTLQLVCPVTKKLMVVVEPREDDDELIRNMKSTLSVELSNRTKTEDLPLLAAMLNPDTKDLPFLSVEEQERGRNLLKEKAEMVAVKVKKEVGPDIRNMEPGMPQLPSLEDRQTDGESDDIVLLEPEPKRVKIQCADSIGWLDDVCITGETSIPKETLIETEIKKYFDMERKQSDSSLTLLQWWSENEYQFPRLSQVAKAVLAVPASSVPSERVFSLAGTIVSKKRNRLSPENVNKFIFMNINRRLYW